MLVQQLKYFLNRNFTLLFQTKVHFLIIKKVKIFIQLKIQKSLQSLSKVSHNTIQENYREEDPICELKKN